MRSYANVGRKKHKDKIIISFYCETELMKLLDEHSLKEGLPKSLVINNVLRCYLKGA